MIDFELYRIFIKVADEKNLTRASELLNISQPAVTKRIKDLENQMNTKLFDRSKLGMTLTKNGAKLYTKIKEPIKLLENAENIFKSKKEIIIGTRVMIFSRLFGQSISKFYNIYPEINLVTQYLTTDEIIRLILEQKIDIAIYRKNSVFENPNIKFIKLGELEDIFFVNKNYYKEFNKKVSKEDLKKEIIYLSAPTSHRAQNIIKDFKYNEEELKNIKYTRNTVMIEMLKTENGIGAISKEFIKKELDEGIFKILDTDFKLPRVEFGLYYNRANKFEELDNFINVIKQDFLN